MKKVLHSPWLTVSLAIAVMTTMYTVNLMRNGGIAEASSLCPLHKTCQNGECSQDGACTNENCQHCARCKNEATS